MRVLIVLIAVAILLAFVGWISFRNDEGESGVILNKEAIEQDTRDMLETGDDLIDRARDATSDVSSEDDEVVDEMNTVDEAPDVSIEGEDTRPVR